MITRLTRVMSIAALLTVSLAAPAAAAVIDSTSGPDMLVGTARADRISGFVSSDTISGKAWPDRLYAGAGPDKVYGGWGADTIFPGRDHKREDRLYGGRGPDHIYARDWDLAYAGSGNDTIEISGRRKALA